MPAKKLDVPAIGSEAYAHTMFFVTAGGEAGEIFDDPADAIAQAEENARYEDVPWFVIGLRATDDPPVHVARPSKPKKKTRKR